MSVFDLHAAGRALRRAFMQPPFARWLLQKAVNAHHWLWWRAHADQFASRGEGCCVSPGEFPFKNVHLGNGVRIAGECKFMGVRGHIYIGDKTAMAAECCIVAGNHNTVCDGRFMSDLTEADKRPLDDLDVVIEEDVWFGRRVIVLNGVRIGRGAVVGAGSVVRGRVPPYAIVVGNPASVVGFRATVAQILKHEAALYPPERRLEPGVLEADQKRCYDDLRKQFRCRGRL